MFKASLKTLASALLLMAMTCGDRAMAQSAANGEDLFAVNCGDCHSVAKVVRNKRGPSLFGVYGRTAGQVEGFKYSDPMASSGITWTAEKLDAYIANPKAVFPKGTMKFEGLSKPADRADIIAYLAQLK